MFTESLECNRKTTFTWTIKIIWIRLTPCWCRMPCRWKRESSLATIFRHSRSVVTTLLCRRMQTCLNTNKTTTTTSLPMSQSWSTKWMKCRLKHHALATNEMDDAGLSEMRSLLIHSSKGRTCSWASWCSSSSIKILTVSIRVCTVQELKKPSTYIRDRTVISWYISGLGSLSSITLN